MKKKRRMRMLLMMKKTKRIKASMTMTRITQ